VGIGSFAYATIADSIQAGVIALWCFTVCAAALALVLPMPYALVSPLFMGVIGWLVDMLPFVILIGWGVVVARWCVTLLLERRWPRGGRWVYLPAALLFWTALGVLVITAPDLRHFLLLLAIQFVISGTLLAAVDALGPIEARSALSAGLCSFIIILSSGVFLQWIGVDLQALQDQTVRRRVETAYGFDAFPNNIGMIKYARSINAGALELNRDMKALRSEVSEVPRFEVFRPRLRAYENHLVVRFDGSARPFESQLSERDVRLIYDNVGLAPANTVPRLRSFPRNALTFAGASAAVLPLAFFLWWTGNRRRRLLGQAAVVACLFGIGFSLARGAWAALFLGLVYLLIDGNVDRRAKLQFGAAILVAATVLTGVFLFKYQVDPLRARAGGGSSVATRDDLYRDTLSVLNGKHIFLGYGTARPRTEEGTVREGRRYVPRAGTHSTYLNYVFRAGIPGGLMILALYLIAGLRARAASRELEGDERVFATMTATAIVITGAHAAILSLYVEPIYTLTIALLLGITMAGTLGLRSSVIPRQSGES
jgi:hypothetical protein